MTTERLRRVVDDLLVAAERAVTELAWDQVLDLSEDVLAIEPDNPDAWALRALAERHVGRAIPAAGRRQVTVLFADLVGSTPMGEKLDPEAYLEVIRAYEAACRPRIDRYGGHINRFAGDGLIAFFGYPNAHEDDARRATLAGLEALQALRSVSERAAIDHGVTIEARIGVHTGLVVLGDRGSAAWRDRDDAFGPTVNLAARLQAVARPGTVLLSDSTARLVGSSVELSPRGSHRLRGIDRPVEVFELVRVTDDAGLLPRPARADLVGRQAELTDLLGQLRRIRERPDHPGQAVLLRGEAGVGKSRLLIELLAVNEREGGGEVRLQCSPHLTVSPLHPFRGALHRSAGIVSNDPVTIRLDKLVGLVESLGLPADETVPYLAIPLSLETGDRFDPVELDAPQLKEALLGCLAALVERLAVARPPFVMAVEDVQWADLMTQELLERIIGRGPPSGLLLALASRPTSTWPPAHLAIEVLPVGPLTTDDIRRLVTRTATWTLDDAALGAIVLRSDGVPLYAKQLVDALADREAPSTPDEIPVTLMELLQSRLDSLGSAKPLAQVAATIGREFEVPLLQRVIAALEDDPGYDPTAEQVADQLSRLVNSHVVDVDATDPNRLRFHHALLRDAAYASQLHRVRPGRHRAVARVLADLDAQGRPVDTSLIAYHYDRGGDPAQAIPAYLTAASRAAQTGGFENGLSHVARANELLRQITGPEALRAELGVCLERGRLATALGGWAAEGVMDDYARALELCAQASDDPDLGSDSLRALFCVWNWYCTKGDFARLAEARDAITRQLHLTAIEAGSASLAACLGVESFYRGRFAEARDHLERAVALFAKDDITDWSQWPMPNDPLASACAFLAPTRLVLDDEQGGLAAVAAGLERSRGLPFPHGAFSEGFVRAYEAWLHRARGDLDGAFRAAEELLRLVQRHGFGWWLVVGQLQLSATRVMAEPSRAAVDALGSAIAAYQSFGVNVVVPSLLLEQAAGCLALGDLDPARRCVDEALKYTDQAYARAEGLRLRAEVRAASGGSQHGDESENIVSDLHEAFRLATTQQASYYMRRIAQSYQRLVGADDRDMTRALAEAGVRARNR